VHYWNANFSLIARFVIVVFLGSSANASAQRQDAQWQPAQDAEWQPPREAWPGQVVPAQQTPWPAQPAQYQSPPCNPACSPGFACDAQARCVPVAYGPQAPQQPYYGPQAPQQPYYGQAPPPQPLTEGRVAHGSGHINVLGALGFGITPAIEFGGRHFGVLARVRFPQAGLANHLLFPDSDEGESLGFSIGVSGGARYYLAPHDWMSGFYVGALFEWSLVQVDDPEESKVEVYHFAAIGTDVGYRWNFGGFLLGFGGWFGVALPLSAEDHFDGGEVSTRDSSVTFFAALNADVGFYF
jgi:hypothetical protein